MNDPTVIVRSIRAGEGPVLRRVRIRALRDAPRAFLTTAEHAETLPAVEWDERARRAAADDDRAIFLAFLPHEDEPCGMVAAFPAPDRPGTMELVQMWVSPARRGRGTGRALVDAVIAWSRKRGAPVHLGVADDNAAAVALYRRIGFAPTGETEPHPSLPGVGIVYYELPPDTRGDGAGDA